MQSVYQAKSYKVFIRLWVETQPRGAWVRLADAIGVSQSLLSLTVNGERDLSLEAAVLVADQIGLTEKETQFFLLLVEYERAGSARLKEVLKSQLETQRRAHTQVKNLVQPDQELSEEARSQFYSSFVYSAVRNLTAIDRYQTVEALQNQLQLPRDVIQRVLEFLVSQGLCLIDKRGRYTYGPAWTHIAGDHPLVNKHHQNWRLRAMTRMEQFRDSDLFFTGPMSLSNDLAEELRIRLAEWLRDVQREVRPSKSETARCLNIDWFEI